MISFLRKHPKLLCFAISVLTSVNSYVLSWLTWSMMFLINLKGLDPNPPPPPPPAPPEPKMEDALAAPTRKRQTFIGSPYVPKWVVQSFRDQKQHVINQNRQNRKPLDTVKTVHPEAPFNPPLEVSGPPTKNDKE